MAERLLPVSGAIRMPPGITAADVTVTYLGVLRGGGLVSGGTLKALAGADGVPKVDGAVLRLQVAYPGDRAEQHPFARVGVSYRGAARGYEMLVDLVVEDGATSVPLDRVSSGSELMSAAQVQTVQGLIADMETAKEEARAAAQSVTAAQLDLSKERGAVAQALADTAQARTALERRLSGVATLTPDGYEFLHSTGALKTPEYGGVAYAGALTADTDVSRLVFLGLPIDQAKLPTSVRLVLRDGGPDGGVLSDTTHPVQGAAYYVQTHITCDLPQPVSTQGGRLWATLYFDAPCSLYVSDQMSGPDEPRPRVAQTAGEPVEIDPAFPNARWYAETYRLKWKVSPAPELLAGITQSTDAQLSEVKTRVLDVTRRRAAGYTFLHSTGTPATAEYGGYAYAGLVGEGQGVVKVDVVAVPQDAAKPVTSLRLVLRDGGPDGAVLSDVTQAFPAGQAWLQTRYSVPLPDAVSSDAFWAAVYFNGPAALVKTDTPAPDAEPWPRVAMTPGTEPAEIPHGHPKMRIYLEKYQATGWVTEPTPEFASAVLAQAQPGPQPEPEAVPLLPPRFYAIEGRELRIYPDNIIALPPPRDAWMLDVWEPSGGGINGLEWRKTLTAGDKTLTFSVWQGFDRLPLIGVPLHVHPAVSTATRKLLMMGDSHVKRGQMIKGADDILKALGYQATWLGTQFSESGDGLRNEGYPGQHLVWLDSNPASPFSNGGHFDLANYMANTGQVLGAGDWLLINTGTNEFGGSASVAELQGKIDNCKVVFDRIFAQCKALGIRVGVMYTLPVGRAPHTAHWEQGRDMYLKQIVPHLKGREADGVFIVPSGASVDPLHDFPAEDLVHCTEAGYHHAGEALAAFLAAQS